MLISGGKSIKKIADGGYWIFKKIPNNPNYLIGSNYNGLSIFKKNSGGWQYLNKIEGFDNSTSSFELDEQNIWLKVNNMVYQMSLDDNFKTIKSIKIHKNVSNLFNGIGSIQKIKNKIYFQIRNRFYKYNSDENHFFEDQKMSALFKNIPKINTLTEDSYGNIWYVFNESLGVLMQSKNKTYKKMSTPFSNLTGNLVPNHVSINTVDSNNILIGLTNGLAHYNSQFSTNLNQLPQAVIRRFTYSTDTLIFTNKPLDLKEYELPYASNNVKFTFSSPSYENLKNIEFSCKLDGFDTKWSNWSTNPVKEYTNLKEGDYQMSVKVRYSSGIESAPSTITFKIMPPWYRHYLACFFYIIGIISIIYFILNKMKLKIIETKHIETIKQSQIYTEKENKIRKQQLGLEQEIERLENANLQLKILTKDKELVLNSLQMVKKNKILTGIINKLKDFNVDAFDEPTRFQFMKLSKSISKEVNTDKSLKNLEKNIRNVHFEFLKRLKEKYPTISPREMDLSTYLLMNMSTKEIAEVMNISSSGVELARYRLRKKIGLVKKENLTSFLMQI
ncbi:MAG: LuxR C-terminal-related transcriptional regulator [Sphingobacteriaceae bacterium]|nr:LuxR C-terminal-related transcriptional regulator [Sphingobacteriaceae bacterium]